jgi:hypothetical protein
MARLLLANGRETDMAKYENGSYLCRMFDRYGTKLRDLAAVNFTDAQELGYSQRGDGSFVILRVLFNSLDPHPTKARGHYDVDEDDHK